MPRHSNKTDWVVQINKSLKSTGFRKQQSRETRSIYRVPANIANRNCEAYQPLAVSFGPYHYGKEHLLPMEDHKHRALLQFLKRSGKPVERFLNSLRKVVRDLKASYDSLAPEWKKGGKVTEDRFLQLMITDGCFMLEILRTTTKEKNDYAPNDPIFSKHGEYYILPTIRRDMLLLENQLPMLVLDQLVAVCGGKKEDLDINELILDLYFPKPNNSRMGTCLHIMDVFRKSMLKDEEEEEEEEEKEAEKDEKKDEEKDEEKDKKKDEENNPRMGLCPHVVDVFRKSMLKDEKKDEKDEDSKEIIRSATELYEHGIRFKANENNRLNDISFASGVLKLPMIAVDEDTESIFLNLIAFERSHVGAGSEVMSYIFFMDNIIDKGQDVALLHTEGIIRNAMGSDDAAAKLFNSLAKDVMLDSDSSLRDVMNEVIAYCEESCHMWMAILMHNHFSNPWVALSLIAAVLLFALTIIQTVYAVLSYD